MDLKEKLGYMFIGCLFTLAGYFFASLDGSPSPPNTAHADADDSHFDKLVCKEIVIVNKDGEPVAGITTIEDRSAGIVIGNKDGKRVAGIGITQDGSGIVTIANKDGKLIASLRATETGGGVVNIANKDGKLVASLRATKDGTGGIFWGGGRLNVADENR